MKILSVVFAAVILFSAGTADALDFSLFYGFIKLPQTANLTPDNVSIYVVGREQTTAKPDSVSWIPELAAWYFAADTDNIRSHYEVVIMREETVVAVANFDGAAGFGFLTVNPDKFAIQFSDIVSFVPCQIYESIQMLECGK